MKNIKLETGLGPPDEQSINDKTFILCFIAIIWRRVWITSIIYCNHNKIKNNRVIILKSLKYNIFSNAGIFYTLKPYIKESLTTGFLMPKFFNKNVYATKSVKLYKLAYETVKLEDKIAEIKFIHDYMMILFSQGIKNIEELNVELQDTLDTVYETNPIDNNTYSTKDHRSQTVCKFCTLFDDLDVNVDLLLVFSKDPYQIMLMNGLMNTINS